MRSDTMKKGLERAPHRALMRATGITTEEIKRPFIGVCNSYTQYRSRPLPPEEGRRDHLRRDLRSRRRAV